MTDNTIPMAVCVRCQSYFTFTSKYGVKRALNTIAGVTCPHKWITCDIPDDSTPEEEKAFAAMASLIEEPEDTYVKMRNMRLSLAFNGTDSQMPQVTQALDQYLACAARTPVKTTN